MKTTVAYVLVSNCEDYYFEQLLISMHSLRNHNKDAEIHVVTEDVTFNMLTDKKKELLYTYTTNISIECIPEGYTEMQKSRYLKTQLREIITGDFLYIDLDTVICGDLSGIDLMSHEISAVYDMNRSGKLSRNSGFAYSIAKKIGWERLLLGEPYYNGGLLYVKDTPKTHAFFSRWHELWLDCVKLGVNVDQASLCMANKNFNHLIRPMEAKWNCQINSDGILFTSNALIIHYFNNNYTQYLLARKEVQQAIKDEEKIPSFIIDFIQSPKQIFAKPEELIKIKIKQVFPHFYKLFRFAKSCLK